MDAPKTADDFLDLVDQAIYEADELLMCAADEDGTDFQLTSLLPVYEHLAKALRELHTQFQAGDSRVGKGEDLPFMPLVQKWGTAIPFTDVLDAVNRAYKAGVDR